VKVIDFREGTSDKVVYEEIFKRNVYQKKEFKILPNEKWLDLGGYVGHFSLYVKSKGGIPVAIVEPFGKNIDLIKKNMDVNNINEIKIIKKAISDKFGKALFYINPDGNFQRNTLKNHYKRKKMIMEEIDIIDIESLINDNICVKMDIEGSELDIIDNKPHIFKNIKKLVLEYHLDKDTKLENYYKRIEVLKKYFNTVYHDNLKQKDGSKVGDIKIFPSGRLIYCF